MRNGVVTLGLVGGIGSGKSFVAKIFRKMGAEVIDADAIAHKVLQTPTVKGRIRRVWGNEIFYGNGEIDRKKLAERAFKTAEQIRMLNSIVHPAIRRGILRRLQGCRSRLAVIDAPLILEAGQQGLCTALVFVRASSARRLERVHGRGWDARELRRRERLQWPLGKKQRRADFVVDNNGDLKHTCAQVRRIVQDLIYGSSHAPKTPKTRR